MSDCLLLFSFSLLLAGVFGADDVTVSVMAGVPVTLHINAGKIKGDERLQWKFNDKDFASINLKDKDTPPDYPNERFTNRLNLDRQTGSLTISNTRTKDTGKYQLEIKDRQDRDFKLLKTFSVTVTDQAFTVSVMKGGDSFSLSIGDKIQTDAVKWTFKGTDLTNGGFTDTNVNTKTGELKITNIKPEQSGEYEVKINGSSLFLHKTFSVNINDEVESVSGEKGQSITLNTNIETQADDVIEWTFENTTIAKVDRGSSHHPEFPDVRFRGRLVVDSNGSLIIKEFWYFTDSGLYDVNITNSNHFIHKRFNVTGNVPILWIIGGSAFGVVLIVIGILSCVIHHKKKKLLLQATNL